VSSAQRIQFERFANHHKLAEHHGQAERGFQTDIGLIVEFNVQR
jgi:hypothetical protein